MTKQNRKIRRAAISKIMRAAINHVMMVVRAPAQTMAMNVTEQARCAMPVRQKDGTISTKHVTVSRSAAQWWWPTDMMSRREVARCRAVMQRIVNAEVKAVSRGMMDPTGDDEPQFPTPWDEAAAFERFVK